MLLRFVAVNLFGYGEVGNIYLEVGRAGTAYRGKYQVNLQWVSPRGGNIRSLILQWVSPRGGNIRC